VFGKELFDFAVAEGEAQIQPDRVLEDRRLEGMAAVGEGGYAIRIGPTWDQLSAAVTMPYLPRSQGKSINLLDDRAPRDRASVV
jgi:hypothetical protein